jgi:hypothetical protein
MSSFRSLSVQAAAVMRALAVLVFLWLMSPAQAASIHVIDENGKQGIVVGGIIVNGDDDEFSRALEKVRDKSNTFVFLSGAGGNGIVAVLIGDLVRRSGMLTAVLEGNDCASACAMIWIAGARRIASKNACIGFHGMYDRASGQPSADANAIAGAHLGLLGLSLDAVFWMLTPRQLDTHWLTDETAEKYGIYWTHDKDDAGHSCPNQRSEPSGHQETPARPPEVPPPPSAYTSPVPGPTPPVHADQSSSSLNLFCISDSGRGDGIIVRATEARVGWSLHVVHKVGGQLYDRNVQYQIFAFRQDQSRRSYYWDGVLAKDNNVLMTGHLWLNAGAWYYNEYVSFKDGSQPVKLATPTIMCQPTS